jgi:uncharacterized damage-inducible protein DinB
MEARTQHHRTGAVGALLDEYERSIRELQAVIVPITEVELTTIADPYTEDPNCKSIQTVLAHVVRAGYTYAILILSLKGPLEPYRERVYHPNAAQFAADLDTMFAFTAAALGKFQDDELEEYAEAKKALSPWGQRYDAEQMMEHGIVHILRHRRQIERFLQEMRR